MLLHVPCAPQPYAPGSVIHFHLLNLDTSTPRHLLATSALAAERRENLAMVLLPGDQAVSAADY